MTPVDRSRRLRAGVIAAGRGERLRDGAGTLKPLVAIAGRTLVEHVLSSLAETEPSEVVIIVNEESRRVIDHVMARDWPFALRWIVETTPSSMHSFLRVLEELADPSNQHERFLLSTVDTIAAPGAYAGFVAASRTLDVDVALAVTRPGGDDNPLLVRVHPATSIVEAIGEDTVRSVRLQPDHESATSSVRLQPDDRDVWMTAGYYFVRPTILGEANAARREGLPALRAFLARLVAGGYRVGGVPVAAGVDVDDPRDVGEAEAFVRRVEA